jgi:flagellar biosynthesis chaperone FliJ
MCTQELDKEIERLHKLLDTRGQEVQKLAQESATMTAHMHQQQGSITQLEVCMHQQQGSITQLEVRMHQLQGSIAHRHVKNAISKGLHAPAAECSSACPD